MIVPISFGREEKVTREGYVADFCPVCRSIRAFELFRIEEHAHVYHIELGNRELIAHNANCLSCNSPKFTSARRYQSIVPRFTEDLEALIAHTYPQVFDAYLDRLEAEEIVRENPHQLQAEVRQALLREPLDQFAPFVEEIFASSAEADRTSILTLLGCVVLCGGVMAALLLVPMSEASFDLLIKVLLGLFVASGVLICWQNAHSKTRRMNRIYLARIAQALAPLKPSRQELVVTLHQLAKEKLRIGQKLSAHEVDNLIRHKYSRTNP